MGFGNQQFDELEAEIRRLRSALEEISATFNKPVHLLPRHPSMIAYAALKHET